MVRIRIFQSSLNLHIYQIFLDTSKPKYFLVTVLPLIEEFKQQKKKKNKNAIIEASVLVNS